MKIATSASSCPDTGRRDFLRTTLPLQTRSLRGLIIHLASHQLWSGRSRVGFCKLPTLTRASVCQIAIVHGPFHQISPGKTQLTATMCDSMDKQETRRIKIPNTPQLQKSPEQPSLHVPHHPQFLPSSRCWWSFAADCELLPTQFFSARPSLPVHNTGGWVIEQVSEQQLTWGPRCEFQILDFASGIFNVLGSRFFLYCTRTRISTANPQKLGWGRTFTWIRTSYLEGVLVSDNSDKLIKKESNSVQSFSLAVMIQFILLLFRKNCHDIFSKSCVFRKEPMDGLSFLGHCLCLNSYSPIGTKGNLTAFILCIWILSCKTGPCWRCHYLKAVL